MNMLTRIFLLFFLVTLVNFAVAQVRATTESGNKVLLFDNGTWKYDEQKVNTADKSAGAVAVVGVAAIAIDSSKVTAAKPKDLFYLPSPRLVRYFGEADGNIRCKLGCFNKLGVIQIQFIWEIPVSDGYRYFGWFKEGSKVTFTMEDGEQVEVIMGDENDKKVYEKSNYSMISNVSQPLSQEQIASFISKPLDKMEVDWKKKPEEYHLESPRFLMDMLPTVF